MWGTDKANKDHRHEENGDKTVDLERGNNPDFVCDFTENLTAVPEFLDLGRFDKVKFENVPGDTLFGSPEKCAAIVDNIHAVAKEKSKVTVLTGSQTEGQNLDNICKALENKGYVIKSRNTGAVAEIKAQRK